MEYHRNFIQERRSARKLGKICDCFNCSICLKIACDAEVAYCGHLYCGSCIYNHFKSQKASKFIPCVVCTAPIYKYTTFIRRLYAHELSLRGTAAETLPHTKPGLLRDIRRSINAAVGFRKFYIIFMHLIILIVGYFLVDFIEALKSFFPSLKNDQSVQVYELAEFLNGGVLYSSLVASLMTRMLARKQTGRFAVVPLCIGFICYIWSRQHVLMLTVGHSLTGFAGGLFLASLL